MNRVDEELHRRFPNNALLMFAASLGVVFSAIQIIFIHMDFLNFIGLATMLLSLELYFSAYNYLRNEILWLIPMCIIAMISNIIAGLYLILKREEHCKLAYNYPDCFTLSAIYGVVVIICGTLIYGISAVLAYYFDRLFHREGPSIVYQKNSHLFNKADLMKYVEVFDRMKKPTDIKVESQLLQSPIAVS